MGIGSNKESIVMVEVDNRGEMEGDLDRDNRWGWKKGGRKNKNKNENMERKRSEGSKIVVSSVRIRGWINTKDKESVGEWIKLEQTQWEGEKITESRVLLEINQITLMMEIEVGQKVKS